MANEITTVDALNSLKPNAQWVLRWDTLEWLDSNQTQPTQSEIDAEIVKLQAEYDAQEYARKRQAEYPPMADYLDAIVKGDEAQKQKYIDDCKAVKEKYPKWLILVLIVEQQQKQIVSVLMNVRAVLVRCPHYPKRLK